ncbi:MAG: hypothetical protein ACRDU8_01385 [Egibacteraceae bacterium]
MRLPLLFLYGRSDLSVDYYGANVTPDSVGEVLYSLDELAPHLAGFRLIATEGERYDTTLEVAIELGEGSDPAALDGAGIAARLCARLAEVNGDFRNAYYHTATPDQHPRVSLHRKATGPFAGGGRIKQQYVASGPQYDAL